MREIHTKATPDNGVTPRELAHRALARAAAAESIVLLKNDGTLPIKPCAVALYGAGAATTIKGGTGSGEVNERSSVTIEQGLKNAGFTVTTDAWLREYETRLRAEKAAANRAIAKKLLRLNPGGMTDIVANGFQYPVGRPITGSDVRESGADTCVYVIARQAGESADRSLEGHDFDLTGDEIENLKIAAAYPKTVVVINAGGPMGLSPLEEMNGVNAILFFCQQGMEGGSALADILTGGVTPSGCLSATWPKRYGDLPNAMEYSYLKGNTGCEEYKEGIYVGYRYFDSFHVEPRYAFGYGLSYTDFSIEFAGAAAEKSKVTVKTRVTNTGKTYAGKKCVQLYVSVPGDRLNREYQSLAAFAKTETLAPGQSQELTLGFDLTGVAAYDALSASYGLERGDYILRLGENAQMTKPIAVLALDGDAVAERCANVCKLSRNLREIRPEKQRIDDLSDGIPRFSVAASDIPCRGDSPRPPASSPPTPVAAEPVPGPKIEAVLKKLSLDDMLRIVVATGPSDFNPYFTVPGAAAYTTSRLVKLGVPNAALCDGPAGLRLQRTSVRLKSGKIKPVDAMMEFMAYMPWPLRKFYFGNPQKGTPLYQYATAFPVGTALAQTWNTPLIEEVGKALGAEMTEFGVTFLLAPGMNIQRNPLCGRNYEYYSEDPLLSGKMAAAVTRGVQSFPGCAVTLKHFAANNQEAGRSHSDSVLSERALREIYLKGFRIAVEEGGAKAVMTSYNKINGVYAANSGDLCTKLLRGEWGFDGVVMTDWYSTGKGLAGNGRAVKAGNDLLCPGGSRYRKALKKDLKAGLVTETEIRLSCARVLEAVVGR